MTTQHQPLGLPAGLNPDALDTLSDLANVLSRLRSGTGAGAGGGVPGSSATGPSGTSSLSSSINPHGNSNNNNNNNNNNLHSSGATPGGSAGSSNSPLALKDLPGQSDQLRHRFQKARALIKTLPDMDRTIAEQEDEMASLQAQIARQKETLEKLKALGARFSMSRDDGDDDERDGDRMEE